MLQSSTLLHSMRANLAPAIIYGSAFGLTWGFSCVLLNLFKYPYFCSFYICILFTLNGFICKFMCTPVQSNYLSLFRKVACKCVSLAQYQQHFFTKKFCLVLAQSFLVFAAQKGNLPQYEGATLKLVFNVAIFNVRGILRIESFSFMLPSIG